MKPIDKARSIAARLTYRAGFGRPYEFEVQGAQLNALIAIHDLLSEIAGKPVAQYAPPLKPSEIAELRQVVGDITGEVQE
ncbi:hypothetical protein [Nocardia niwae]|uniref:hypothetical protein n=1 Tax=Nocardia niwae TaxID=626084 RepID=UPI0007A3B71E|nr:hypothetical protein [Nocardia niwae]